MIQAKDLMICDWVTVGNQYAQVTSITCDGLIETDVCASIEEITELIPLTPEILMANNFEYKEGWDEWWHEAEDGFGSDFQLSVDEDCFTMKDIENVRIEYVHQLQQAFRLCGLSDIADNLKVE